MNISRIQTLLEKYRADTLLPEEQEELTQLLHAPGQESELEELVMRYLKGTEVTSDNDALLQETLFQQIKAAREMPTTSPTRGIVRHLRKFAAAAAIILLGGAAWYLLPAKQLDGLQMAGAISEDSLHIAPPPSAKAVITLSNGQQIVMDSAGLGTLAMQGNTSIVKSGDDELRYEQAGATFTDSVFYNTLTVPRGSKIVTIFLPDGTKVWLNSSSSLRYPTAFRGKERRVEITGELYFDVSTIYNSDGSKIPFTVSIAGQREGIDRGEVKVLGTGFNINAYPEESPRVLLIHGSVSVSRSGRHSLLKPGQLASLKEEHINVSQSANPDQVIAWKNGRFQFDGANLAEIMRTVSRWYNVDVVYDGDVKNQHFRGGISRDVDVTEVLSILAATKTINFKITQKTIIVTP